VKNGSEPFFLLITCYFNHTNWKKGSDPFFCYNFLVPRIPRIVIPDIPYHITQRGNNGQDVFFSNTDRKYYLSWLLYYSKQFKFDIIAYCLMSNHVHFIGIPRDIESMLKTIQTVHMRHTQSVNNQKNRTGHLWHSRYYSTPLDDKHLWHAIRYVEHNPVRAGIVRNAEDYLWSSAAFHCGLRDDILISKTINLPGFFDNWIDILHDVSDDEFIKKIRHNTFKGIPCGSEEFVENLSLKVGYKIFDRGKGRPRKK